MISISIPGLVVDDQPKDEEIENENLWKETIDCMHNLVMLLHDFPSSPCPSHREGMARAFKDDFRVGADSVLDCSGTAHSI